MNQRQLFSSRSQFIEAVIHAIGWVFVFGFPFLMMSRSGFSFSWMDYLKHGCAVPLSFLIVFYTNYCYLIPHFHFRGRTKQYLLLNVLLIACTAVGVHLWQEFIMQHYQPGNEERHIGPPRWIFVLRDIFSMVLTTGLSVAIRLSARWSQIENARREAEKSRTEAELKNLRNQLNPHFLLNTLNNIYALIAFDSDKAQAAVQELSRLLRHVLYDNQESVVPLEKEMDFIRNYIELMRIRLASNVELKTSFDIHPDTSTKIAPLIFISLIENAFKHGISPTEPSYIRIRFSETQGKVCCDIRNSYHPKSDADKSGSGIGLGQVSKRLELIYPDRHNWQQGVDPSGKEYRSILTITP